MHNQSVVIDQNRFVEAVIAAGQVEAGQIVAAAVSVG